jgi:hypothetical protein
MTTREPVRMKSRRVMIRFFSVITKTPVAVDLFSVAQQFGKIAPVRYGGPQGGSWFNTI